MKKTVAHFSLYYFELSENWIHTQIKHIDDWNRIVFTNRTKNLDTLDWIPDIYSRNHQLSHGMRLLDSIAMNLIGYYPSYYLKLKQKTIHIMHAHFGPMGVLCSAIARKLNIPLLTTFYGYDVSELPTQKPQWNSNYKKLFETGSRFLVEGPAMGKKLEALGCPAEKITVHHLGIETDKYKVKKEYSNEGRPLQLMMIGRFVEKKGFIFGLQAFHRFLENGGDGVLTIYGDSNGTDNSEGIKDELLNYIQVNNLTDRVRLPGLIPLEKLQHEYYKYDVFMAPSVKAGNGDDEGGAPVTIIEASASGLPVIGSKHCDIPEIVIDEDTGLLTEEKNIVGLTEHIFRLNKDMQLRQKLGQQGKIHIKKNFCAIKQGKAISSIYQSSLGMYK